MFSEILKIIPKLDTKDMQIMERNLQSRFTRVAKTFGKGLTNIFKGGGLIGAGLALIDKLLNPLKEVQEAIDRSLKTSDDLATNASQFNTTTGKLAKLVTLAKATGLDEENLYTLITKFQTAVAEARVNPENPNVSAVRNYIDQEDFASGFFSFIQQLQKMDKASQVLVQQQVFGEKQILKMADFLQQDFEGLAQKTGINKVSSEQATRSIESLSALADLADTQKASREFTDLIRKGSTINESMIRARDKAERIALERENQRIQSYNDLQAISSSVDKMMIAVEKGVAMLGNFMNQMTPFLDKVSNSIDALMKSPIMRGIKGIFGGEK